MKWINVDSECRAIPQRGWPNGACGSPWQPESENQNFSEFLKVEVERIFWWLNPPPSPFPPPNTKYDHYD